MKFFFIESYSYILIILILYKSQLLCCIKKLPTLTELLGSVLTSVMKEIVQMTADTIINFSKNKESRSLRIFYKVRTIISKNLQKLRTT